MDSRLNPFDSLPSETLQAIAVYSWIGMVVCAVLGLLEVDKARRAAAKPVLPVLARSAFAWIRCPNGHCQVLANRDWSCPECGAGLVPA